MHGGELEVEPAQGLGKENDNLHTAQPIQVVASYRSPAVLATHE